MNIDDTIRSVTVNVNDSEFNTATITFERCEFDMIASNHGPDTLEASPRKREAVA